MLLSVRTMSCGHCVRTLSNAVRSIDPQADVEVSLAHGTVRITGAVIAEDAARVIREEGYTVLVIEA